MFPTEQRPTQEDKVYPELPVSDLAPKRKSSPLVRVMLMIVALAVIVGAGLFLLNQHNKSAQKATSTSPAKSNTGSSGAAVTDIDSTTKRYDSTNFSIGFDYPADWSISDPGSGKLSVISPMLQLRAANGQAINARIVMTIQNQQSSISQFAANTAIAPLASQKLTYKQPTPSQRAKTYLTFVNYAGSSKAINALYITGDNGYTAGQYVPGSDIAKDDPLVSIGFFGCSDTACSNYSSAAAIAVSSWSDAGLSKPLINLLQSLVID